MASRIKHLGNDWLFAIDEHLGPLRPIDSALFRGSEDPIELLEVLNHIEEQVVLVIDIDDLLPSFDGSDLDRRYVMTDSYLVQL